MARKFTRSSSENIICASGSASSIATSITVVAIAKIDNTNVGSGGAATLVQIGGPSSDPQHFVLRIGDGGGTTDKLTYATNATAVSSTSSVQPADGWCLLAVTKTAGTTAPRFHKYVYNSNSWTRDNGSSVANTSKVGPTDTVRIGTSISTGTPIRFLDGSIAAMAIFSSALSDAQMDVLPFALNSWASFGPSAMWVLDQASASVPVVDWTGGGANQSAVTGTSVATASSPIGYGHSALGPTRSSGAEHLFRNQTPTVTDASDGTPGITTATTIRFAADGTVPAVRFFATTTVGGTYTAGLWSVDSSDPGGGTLLQQKSMAAAPTPGTWNTVTFDTPVSVTSAGLYRASLFSSGGRYVATTGFFTADLVNGNLTADASGDTVAGKTISQGTFRIASVFGYPNTSGSGTSYFVDVDFFAGAPAGASGTVTAGLPALTAAAAGTVPVSGSADVLLPALTGATSGTVATSGTLTGALPALTASVSGTATASGTLAAPLPALQAAVVADVAGATSGTVTAVLPALATTAAGTVATSGTTAVVLPALGAAASATVTATGTTAASLPALTATIVGTANAVAGTITATLPPLGATGSGTASTTGLAQVTLPALVAAATGVSPAVGTIAATLPALTASLSDVPVYTRRPGTFTTGSRRSTLTTGGHR